MPQDHRAQRQALGKSGANEVAAQNFEHAAAREPRNVGQRRQRQGHRGQHEMANRAGLPSSDRQPVQVDAEQQAEKRQHHKGGNREPKTASDIVA